LPSLAAASGAPACCRREPYVRRLIVSIGLRYAGATGVLGCGSPDCVNNRMRVRGVLPIRPEEHDAMTQIELSELEVYDYARQLFEAHGAKAIAEAAQKATTLAQQGDEEQAETWRHIEAALKLMRGPSVS
jgi:hypothetical protein